LAEVIVDACAVKLWWRSWPYIGQSGEGGGAFVVTGGLVEQPKPRLSAAIAAAS
jgi:hypothetical protein